MGTENKKFTIFKKKENKYGAEETELLEIVKLLCEHRGTEVRVDPNNFQDYLIENKTLHYDAIIDSIGIKITNSEFTVIERFESSFLNELKAIAKHRCHEDISNLKAGILSRKTSMLSNMKNVLQINK